MVGREQSFDGPPSPGIFQEDPLLSVLDSKWPPGTGTFTLGPLSPTADRGKIFNQTLLKAVKPPEAKEVEAARIRNGEFLGPGPSRT